MITSLFLHKNIRVTQFHFIFFHFLGIGFVITWVKIPYFDSSKRLFYFDEVGTRTELICFEILEKDKDDHASSS